MMLYNFLNIFYHLVLNQIFSGLSNKIFHILHKLDEITNRIPVADLSLDQACIYHLRAHHKIDYTAQNNKNFTTFISASGTPSSGKK